MGRQDGYAIRIKNIIIIIKKLASIIVEIRVKFTTKVIVAHLSISVIEFDKKS
jgi:hypothetical protein